MEEKLVPIVHRFTMYLKMDEMEIQLQAVARTLIINIKKHNASWTAEFFISTTESRITFSTSPANVLREMGRITCRIPSDPEIEAITFENGEARVDQKLRFFEWRDVEKVYRASGCVQICFELVDACLDENAIMPRLTDDSPTPPSFESGECSDVLIQTPQKEFKAHKLVLAARSSVFAAMLKNDMQEASTGKVTIENVRAEVVEEMLRYMYSDVTTKLPEMPCELYAAARMYDVRDLQWLCVDYLLTHVCVDNVVDISKLCDTYELQNVREKVSQFINDNAALFVKQGEYLAYLKKNVSVENICKNLMLVQQYELSDFKDFLMDFIPKNYAQVMKNHDYLQMYDSEESFDLILEIDEYVSNYIVKLHAQCGID